MPQIYNLQSQQAKGVSARILGDRFDLLKAISPNISPEDLVKRLMEFCILLSHKNNTLHYKLDSIEGIAGNLNNTKILTIDEATKKPAINQAELDNSVNKILSHFNLEQQTKLVREMLERISTDEFQPILQTFQKGLPLTESENTDQIISDLDPINLGRQRKLKNLFIESFLMGLGSTAGDTGTFIESVSDLADNLESIRSGHIFKDMEKFDFKSVDIKQLPNIAPPTLGFVFLAAYDTKVNDAFLRNAFTEYEQAIRELSTEDIDAVLTKFRGDPEAQIDALKEIAKIATSNKLYYHTLYPGCVYSVIFGTLIGAVLLPFGLAAATFGIFVSWRMAKRNSSLLQSKVDKFINQPVLDSQIVARIQEALRHKASNIPLDADGHDSNATTKLRASAYFLHYLTLLFSGLHVLGPPWVAFVATASSALSLKALRSFFSTAKKHPVANMHSNLDIDTETIAILPPNWGKSLIKKYLLYSKGLRQVKRDMAALDIPIKPNKWRYTRNVMSFFGLMESNEVNEILGALYSANDPASIDLLEKYRNEVKTVTLEDNLTAHLNQKGFFAANVKKKLGISKDKDLKAILADHASGKSDDFYKLMRDYLENAAYNKASKSVRVTGLFVGVSGALITIGVGLTLAAIGLTPVVWPFAIGIAALGIIGTYTWGFIKLQQMKRSMQNASKKEFTEALQSTHHTYFSEFAGYTAHSEFLSKTKFESSFSKLLRMFVPKATRKQTKTVPDAIKATCKNLAHPNIQRYINTTFVPREQIDRSIFIHGINAALPKPAPENLLITAPPTIKDRFGLHGGKEQSWQWLFAFMSEHKIKECAFSFGNVDLEKRAKQFVEALILEFMSPGHVLRCNIDLIIEDKATKNALLKVLQQPGSDLDKVRAHFGLVLANGQLYNLNETKGGMMHPALDSRYMQNTRIFENLIDLKPAAPAEIVSSAVEPLKTVDYKKSISILSQSVKKLEDSTLLCSDQELRTRIIQCFTKRNEAFQARQNRAGTKSKASEEDYFERELQFINDDFEKFISANGDKDSLEKQAREYYEKRSAIFMSVLPGEDEPEALHDLAAYLKINHSRPTPH